MALIRVVASLAALPAFGVLPATGDPGADLAAKVASATRAGPGLRIEDFVRFEAGPGTTLSLACGEGSPSSVGVRFRGDTPPDGFYDLFGAAGEAVTGAAAAGLAAAAHEARAAAQRRRHARVPLDGVLVTCAVTHCEKGPLTLCAAIEKDDRI